MSEPSLLLGGSLVSACLSSLTGQIWQLYETHVPLRPSENDWKQNIPTFEKLVVSIFEAIPTSELAQTLVENLFLLNPTLGFLVSILAAKFVTRVSNSVFPSITEPCGIVPLDFLASRLRCFLPHLKRVEIGGINIGDEVLRALAESEAASTLEGLELSDSCITDASRGVWTKFQSLRELSMLPSPRITLATIQEIANLPRLENLFLSTGFDLIDRIIKIILAPQALPNLRKFVVGGPCSIDGVQATLLELLEKRPTSYLIEEMIFGSINANILGYVSFDTLCCLRTLCPNLKCHLNGIPFLQSHTELPNLQTLQSMYLLAEKVEDLQMIAAAAPNITELMYYDEFEETAALRLDFSTFSSLKDLDITISSEMRLSALPGTLSSLALTLDADRDQAIVSPLCHMITKQCFHIKKIKILCFRGTFSGEEIPTLLLCPQLETLSFKTDDEYDQEDSNSSRTIVLHHLRLIELELYTRATTAHFSLGYLPNLRKLSLDTFDRCSFEGQKPNLPVLHSLHLASGVTKQSANRIEQICATVTSLRGLRFDNNPTFIDKIEIAMNSNIFRQVHDLRRFEFDGAAVSWEELHVLCDSLPRLSLLRATVNNSTTYSSPLKHCQLQVLELSSSDTEQIDTLGELSFIGKNLPLLVELRLTLKSSCDSMVISGLPHLASLSIASDYELFEKETRTKFHDVHVSSCDALASLSLSSFVVSSVRLDCPASRVTISGVHFLDPHLFDVKSLQSLRHITLESFEADQQVFYDTMRTVLDASNPSVLDNTLENS